MLSAYIPLMWPLVLTVHNVLEYKIVLLVTDPRPVEPDVLNCSIVKNVSYVTLCTSFPPDGFSPVVLEPLTIYPLICLILDNQAAIDYLLLLHHQGCENVIICCFNLSDTSQIVHKLMLCMT